METQHQLMRLRREKYEKILSMGIDPFPAHSHRTHHISQLLADQSHFIDSAEVVSIVGRIVSNRRQGKIGFMHILDMSGRLQIFTRQDRVGEGNYELYKLLDLGDIVQVCGVAVVTQTGEFSLLADTVTLLAKNLRPLPTVKEKEVDGRVIRYDEFSDIELRYRKRYLDLLLNPDHRHTFEMRSAIISFIRKYLGDQGFLEVETPVLQPLYGGANARPFTTHHNTLDTDFYLRIATELYLKRLVIGGFERVFEIGKNFRNEGMDRSHNPEYTCIEIYQAYSDLDGMIELTESLLGGIAEQLLHTDQVRYGEHTISLARPFQRESMLSLIEKYTGQDFSSFDQKQISDFLKEKKIKIEGHAGIGKMLALIFDHFVEEHLLQPTFVTDYPLEISPLAKNHPTHSGLVQRFELFIGGREYANAFTELNNPLEQRSRLEAQALARELGDEEANVVDEDFIEALEYGMPPTGGLGIGIDRLVMLFTDNSSIKEVIFFPQMKSTESHLISE